MEIFQIAMIGTGAMAMALYLKGVHPEFSVLISLMACTIVMFYIVTKLAQVFELFRCFQSLIPLKKEYLQVLIKMIGITYVTEFAVNICKDGGYQAIASQIEIFGKISVLAVSIPVFQALLVLIQQMFR